MVAFFLPSVAATALGSHPSSGGEGRWGEELCDSKAGQRPHQLQVKKTDLNCSGQMDEWPCGSCSPVV